MVFQAWLAARGGRGPGLRLRGLELRVGAWHHLLRSGVHLGGGEIARRMAAAPGVLVLLAYCLSHAHRLTRALGVFCAR